MEYKYAIDDMNECICSICFDIISNNSIKLICNHKFHASCLDDWIILHKKNNYADIHFFCPYCRKKYIKRIMTNTKFDIHITDKLNFLFGMIVYTFICVLFLFLNDTNLNNDRNLKN